MLQWLAKFGTNHSNFVGHYNNVFVKLHVGLDTQRVFMESSNKAVTAILEKKEDSMMHSRLIMIAGRCQHRQQLY